MAQLRNLVVLLALLVAPIAYGQALPAPEPTPAEAEATRSEVALKTLKGNPGTVVVFAKGLCCQSCAVGVRTKVKPLAFVDSSRLTEGVSLDAQHQLATIAVKRGKAVSPKALSAAVDSAGYEPVSLYTLKRGKLVRIELTAKRS